MADEKRPLMNHQGQDGIPPHPENIQQQEQAQEHHIRPARGQWCLLVCALLLGVTAAVMASVGLLLSAITRVNLSNSVIPQLQEKYTTYERLGHEDCPSALGTTRIYTGFIAGFPVDMGGTSFKCLPTERPDIKYYNDSSTLFGSTNITYSNQTEYETFREGKTDYDAKCALCSVQGRNTVLMLPANYECPQTWTREYHGYLMTEKSGNTFVCVDYEMGAFQNSHEPVPSHPRLVHIVGSDSNIHSDDYQQGKVLSCSVCTK